MIDDVYDMLEDIEQNIDSDFEWADNEFIRAMFKRNEKGKNFTPNMIKGIENIWRATRKR